MSDFHLRERIGALGLRFLNHTHEAPTSLEAEILWRVWNPTLTTKEIFCGFFMCRVKP